MKKVTLFKSGDIVFINLAHVSQIRRNIIEGYTYVVFAYTTEDFLDCMCIQETPEELLSAEINYVG